MKEYAMNTIGLDLGDKNCTICVLDSQGEVVEETRIATTPRGIERYFKACKHARVVLELGTHSPWVSRQIEELGHEVIVANPRRVRLIAKNNRKSDKVDAELLARLGRADPKLLAPVRHRGKETQEHLALIRARDVLVRTRTTLINSARGLAKSQGVSLPSCSADSFHNKARLRLPSTLGSTLEPLLATIEQHTLEIRTYDKRIDELCETTYAETQSLRQIVGTLPRRTG